MAAFFKDISWAAVIALLSILVFCCVLAIIWSKREWNSRKIRVGMFLEREYRGMDGEEGAPPPAPTRPEEEITREWPAPREEE